MDGLTVVTTETEPPAKPLTRAERASVWLGAVVFPDASEPHPGTLVKRRLSSVDTAEVPGRLLRTWTDQGEDQSKVKKEPGLQTIPSVSDVWRDSSFSFSAPSAKTPTQETSMEEDLATAVTYTAAFNNLSPKDPRINSIASGQHSLPSVVDFAQSALSEPLSKDEITTTTGTIRKLLRSFKADLSATEVNLHVVYGGHEKVLGELEDPADVFTQYQTLGLAPRLLLCKAPT